MLAKLAAVGGPVSLVKEGPFYFMVLNRKDNTFNKEIVAKIDKILDEITVAQGERVLVTISVGSNETFSTGFDKSKDPLERLALYGQMQHLCRKLL